METTFSYSLRKYLDDAFAEISRSVIIDGDVSLTNVPKPFATIQYLGENDELLSAGRVSYEEIHHYQIGIYASNGQQLGTLSAKLKELLRAPRGIPVYDIATGKPTSSRFIMDVGEYTPMTADDTANETFKHHGFFIVDIEILRNAGELTFTQ